MPRIFEKLDERLPFAVSANLGIDFFADDFTFTDNQVLVLDRLSNSSHRVSLHPDGEVLSIQAQQALVLPPSAVDLAIASVTEGPAWIGVVEQSNGSLDPYLWIDENTPVALPEGIPLDLARRSDHSLLAVVETDLGTELLAFSEDGVLQQRTTLGIEDFVVAVAEDGSALFGDSERSAVVFSVSQSLTISEIFLEVPLDAVAEVVGATQSYGETLYVGTTFFSEGTSAITFWNTEGERVHEVPDTNGILAQSVSGSVVLCQGFGGSAILLIDSAIAEAAGVVSVVPLNAEDFPEISALGLREVEIDSAFEYQDTLVLGLSGVTSTFEAVNMLYAVNAVAFPSPWQNPYVSTDVNRDGRVSALDALLVINDINRKNSRRLSKSDLDLAFSVDTSGDGFVSPIDALRVINELNRRAHSGGEGEQALFWFDLDDDEELWKRQFLIEVEHTGVKTLAL